MKSGKSSERRKSNSDSRSGVALSGGRKITKKSFAEGEFSKVVESITECQGCQVRLGQTLNKISLFFLRRCCRT